MPTVVTADQRKQFPEWAAAKDKENATPSQANPAMVQQLQSAADAFKAKNWGPNQTANGLTSDQNLAAVVKQPGNTVANNPTPYIQGVLSRASQDDANQVHINSQPTPAATPTSQPTQTQQLQQSQPSQSSGNASLINQQYDANYASQLQKLQEARQIQQQGLNQQETGVNQNALQNLNNNDAMATRQLKQLQEVQANNGVSGGDSITAAIGNQTAQQQGANSINQDKMNQLTDIQQKRSLINNNASANDLALMQQLQATRSGQLIDNNNTQDQRSLQLAMLMGKDANGNSTLGGQQQALAQQGQNFNQNLQTNQFNQSANNQAFNQNLQTNQFGLQQQNQNFTQGMDQQKMQQSAEQFAKTMGLNYAQLSVQQQNLIGQLAVSQQNANSTSQNASTNATQANNSYQLGLGNQAIAQQNADSEGALRTAQSGYYSDKGNSLTNKQDQLDIKAFATERDGMINSVRTGKVDIPTAMAQINQDESLGVYAPDLAEKLRENLRILGGNTMVPGDPKTSGVKIDTSKIKLQPNQSVTQNVFGG
jgi:hypothetical protein